jgi:hypothetical protein
VVERHRKAHPLINRTIDRRRSYFFATHENSGGQHPERQKTGDKWDTLTKQMIEKTKEIRSYGKYHNNFKENPLLFRIPPPLLVIEGGKR